MFQTDDTIVAISTAAGTAGRAIVRLSGPKAASLAGRVFRPRRGSLARLGGFRTAGGAVTMRDGGIELPACVYMFRAPRSYTRQDVVELHIPGAAAAAVALTDQLIGLGARLAEAGEFTARALLAGRIDLSQAQAVADVVNAADDSQLRSGMAALGGRVRHLCERAASKIADALATVEASIDLAEEDITLEAADVLAGRLGRLAEELGRIADQAASMPEAAEHPHVAITGRPNAGKSSLLNALTGADRAIVSALAGTTRDVLSAAMTLLDGASVILQDAAGFGRADTQLAAAADSAARQAVARADAILFVADAAAGASADDIDLLAEVRASNPRAPLLLLANKSDLPGAAGRLGGLAGRARSEPLATSATLGTGLDEVRKKLTETLHLGASRSGSAMGLHDRQKRYLLAGAAAAAEAGRLLAAADEIADVAELAAAELRAALAHLGQISGQIADEDILARIFGRFCVGK